MRSLGLEAEPRIGICAIACQCLSDISQRRKRYAPRAAAPQRQQVVNCASSSSPHCQQVQGAPAGAAAAFARARKALASNASSTHNCGQVSSMGRSPRAPARYWLRSSHSIPALISTLRACATCSSEAARYTSFMNLLAQGSKKRAHVLASLQRFDQGRANHHAVHVRCKARHLLARANAESRAYRNGRTALDAIHVVEHITGHFGGLAGGAGHRHGVYETLGTLAQQL